MGAAEAHRHTEALGASHDHVGAELAGRRGQRAEEQIGRDRGGGVGGVQRRDDRGQVGDASAGARLGE